MKTIELLEGYYKPGYDAKSGNMIGTQADWMKALGVTKDDIVAARPKAKELPSYKKLLDLVKDISTDRLVKNGTFYFEKPDATHKDKYMVYANGQIRSQAHTSAWGSSAISRDPQAPTRLVSPKPRLKHGDPVQSLVLIYDGAFKELIKKAAKRKEKAEK